MRMDFLLFMENKAPCVLQEIVPFGAAAQKAKEGCLWAREGQFQA